jgi:hypothetical protein
MSSNTTLYMFSHVSPSLILLPGPRRSDRRRQPTLIFDGLYKNDIGNRNRTDDLGRSL